MNKSLTSIDVPTGCYILRLKKKDGVVGGPATGGKIAYDWNNDVVVDLY